MRPFEPTKIPVPPNFSPLVLDPGRPLDVEIGCGVGFHPLRRARDFPERQLVAFERTDQKFAKFQRRIQNHDPLPNLMPVHGDALAWISHGIGPRSVDQYFLLYPNPYPKERQKNLRFHNMPFFSLLLRTLKPGGLLLLASNEAFYVQEAEKTLIGVWGMELREKKLVSQGDAPRSHFEKKYMARGENCWNLVFENLHGVH